MKRRLALRQRLLNWHYSKSRSIKILDLLQSDFQSFRYSVGVRLGDSKIDFRDAIKKANTDELERLDNIILEDKIDSQRYKRRQ